MIEVLKQALEALDEITDDVDGTGLNTTMSFDKSLEAITSLRQAIAEMESQEPVAWMRKDATLRFADGKMFAVGQPFYTHPPQRTWVGLTDEEIASVANNNHPLNGIRSYARAIEAKLKEKNI